MSDRLVVLWFAAGMAVGSVLWDLVGPVGVLVGYVVLYLFSLTKL